MTNWMMLNFQDSCSYMSFLMISFHDYVLMILLFILFFILYVGIWFMMNNFINLKILFNHLLELIWTMIPVIFLLMMAYPSLKILYMFEESMFTNLTVKILGHQWYWSYEYGDFPDVGFDSFIMNFYDKKNIFRLLDVDNRLVLPSGIIVRGLVGSFDVIHSWALPSMGIKVDAVPGRINQFYLNILYSGVFYGQCSEICGLNHSFMPIVVESISLDKFFGWLLKL